MGIGAGHGEWLRGGSMGWFSGVWGAAVGAHTGAGRQGTPEDSPCASGRDSAQAVCA